MTTSPPEDAAAPEDAAEPEADAGSGVAAFAERVAAIAGSDTWSADFGNAKVMIDRDRWVEAVRAVRDGAGLDFFSFLSAVDWSNEVAVGEPLEDEVEERYEILVRLSSGRTNDAVTLATEVPKGQASLPTLTGVYGGADWHEREAAEMFGIDFVGHPNLSKLYLTDEFEGHPLRKDYPLLSREIKPWPGTVDVEDMPSSENAEAGESTASDEEAGDRPSAVGSDATEAESREPDAGAPEGGPS